MPLAVPVREESNRDGVRAPRHGGGDAQRVSRPAAAARRRAGRVGGRREGPAPRDPRLHRHAGHPDHHVPAARVRAALPPHDPALHGVGHAGVRHVHAHGDGGKWVRSRWGCSVALGRFVRVLTYAYCCLPII